MPAGRQSRYVAAALLTGLIVSIGTSQPLDPVKQREEQKKIKARIDEAARRLGSTIDAMAYQRLSATTERKMLEGVDVLAHAVCDAYLGALGLPDMGARFPDTDPRLLGRSREGLRPNRRSAGNGCASCANPSWLSIR